MLPVGQETRRGRVLGWGIPTAANETQLKVLQSCK